jgi:hypothetical protein
MSSLNDHFNPKSVYYLPIEPSQQANDLTVNGNLTVTNDIIGQENLSITGVINALGGLVAPTANITTLTSNSILTQSLSALGSGILTTTLTATQVNAGTVNSSTTSAAVLNGAFAGTTTGVDINGAPPVQQQTINMVIGNTRIQGGLHVSSPSASAVIGRVTYNVPFSAPPVILLGTNYNTPGLSASSVLNWDVRNDGVPLTAGFQLIGSTAPANGLGSWLCIGPV